MFNIYKKSNLFIIMFVMSSFAVLGGLGGTCLFINGHMPQNLYIGDVSVKGLTKQEAIKKVSERYAGSPLRGSVKVKYKDNVNFYISYEEIDAVIDYETTVSEAYKTFPGKVAENLIVSIGGSSKKDAVIVFSVNEFKLKNKLKELAALIEAKPSDAGIFIENGKVIKTEGTTGRKLSIENSAKKIIDSMGQHIDTPIIFDEANEFEIETVYPEITKADFDGVDTIISQYITSLKSPESEYSAKLAASAIHKSVVLPAVSKEALEKGKFSFNKYLWQANSAEQKEDAGYSQVASTLYAAVLKAGIEPASIKRVPHKTYTDYIEPGFDACVGTSDKDFTFSNSLESKLVILSEVSEGEVIVSILGNNKYKDTEITIRSEIIQKYLPTVISVENRDLKQGESIVITNGRPGLKVRAYRQTQKNGAVENEILISTDIYASIDSIVQVGQNTKFQGYK